jgi:SNF2 family DNA or RNA helicase
MFTGELYPYQVEAVDRMTEQRTSLLAFTMGLGKTPTTIAALEDLIGKEKIDKALIVVPASLKWQWADAFAQFTDVEWFRRTDGRVHIERTSCVVIDGNKEQRQFLWELSWELGTHYTICSYNALLADADPAGVWAYAYQAMVLDEATYIKSFRSRTAKAIKKMQPRYRIALSGAPVENRPEEAYSIMQWVDETVFGRWDLFDKSFIARNGFGGVLRYKNLDVLHEKLSTAMIRKSRSDPEVAKYLPEVVEKDIPVALDASTRRSYRRVEKDLLKALEAMKSTGGSFNLAEYYAGAPALSGTLRGRMMSVMQVAHMMLDHPILIHESARLTECTGDAGAQYAWDLLHTPGYVLSETSPKLDALDELVGRMLDEDGKVIIFTQYRRMLDLIDKRLEHHGGNAVLYHGGMSAAEKNAAAFNFNQHPECRLFISTDAGGYGLDLPAANFLVNYDLPYSGGKKAQRDSRHVRASSKFASVVVANLICADTVEERVRQILSLRARLAESIVEGSGKSFIENDVTSLTEHVRASALVTL